MFDFINDFDKEVEKMEDVGTSSLPPRYWYSTGNYVLNRVISGSYKRGIPQGRITDLAGPSGAGKSFISANLAAAAQRAGAFVLVIDTENALDNDFMQKIGVDTDPSKYRYVSVMTIPEASRVVSKFLASYQAAVGESEDAPQVFILIDSLDMLMTETESENFDKGVTKGDQGQKNKQLKAMLRSFVQKIKHLNVAMVCTSQVYKNQDLTNGDGVWIVSDAVKYACSQIILVTKKKLRDESKGALIGDFAGVRMICEGYKTRFTKPFQRVEVEVPYETGMDATSGLLDVAVKAEVVRRAGSWFYLGEEKYRQADLMASSACVEQIVDALESKTTSFLSVDAESDTTSEPSTASRRAAKHAAATAEQAE